MSEEPLKFKLLLDVIGAKQNASALVQEIDKTSQSIQKVGAMMENTLQGRVLKGVVGAIKDNMSTLFNEEIPDALATAQVQIAALGSLYEQATGSKIAGDIAMGAASKALNPELMAQQAALGTVRALSAQLPGYQFSQEEMSALMAQEQLRHSTMMDASRKNLQMAKDAMGTPSGGLFDATILRERMEEATGRLNPVANLGELGGMAAPAVGIALARKVASMIP